MVSDPWVSTRDRSSRLGLRGRLHWRALGEEWVVCAEPLGSLYQLDPLTAAVLALLEPGPLSREGLLAALKTELPGDGVAVDRMADFSSQPDAPTNESGKAMACAPTEAEWGQALDRVLARLAADELTMPYPPL